MNDNRGTYATLGNSCQTSLAILTSNTKYIPLDDPVYAQYYTNMYLYPGRLNEGIVVDTTKIPTDKEQPKSGGCCGKK